MHKNFKYFFIVFLVSLFFSTSIAHAQSIPVECQKYDDNVKKVESLVNTLRWLEGGNFETVDGDHLPFPFVSFRSQVINCEEAGICIPICVDGDNDQFSGSPTPNYKGPAGTPNPISNFCVDDVYPQSLASHFFPELRDSLYEWYIVRDNCIQDSRISEANSSAVVSGTLSNGSGIPYSNPIKPRPKVIQ